MQKPYRNNDELNYFGSDFNKYLNEKCSKEMTVNNIDVIQFKRSKRTIRIIESKHTNEKVKSTQLELLKVVANLFSFLNKMQDFYKLELFILYGDPPYNEIRMSNLITKEEINLKQPEIKQWCEFNLEI